MQIILLEAISTALSSKESKFFRRTLSYGNLMATDYSMLFERLTPPNAALLLIDHQVGTMNFGISDLNALHLKNRTLWLAEAAKVFELPTILTTSNSNGANGPLFLN